MRLYTLIGHFVVQFLVLVAILSRRDDERQIGTGDVLFTSIAAAAAVVGVEALWFTRFGWLCLFLTAGLSLPFLLRFPWKSFAGALASVVVLTAIALALPGSEEKADTVTTVDELEAEEMQPAPAPPIERPGQPQVPRHDWEGAQARLKIGGIIAGQGAYAVLVNGQTYERGDIVSVEHDGIVYRWRIRNITKTDVEWAPLNAR
jgi:hypothetical protein